MEASRVSRASKLLVEAIRDGPVSKKIREALQRVLTCHQDVYKGCFEQVAHAKRTMEARPRRLCRSNKLIWSHSNSWSLFKMVRSISHKNQYIFQHYCHLIFTQFGIPETVVTNTGLRFASIEFANFCHSDRVQHERSLIYRSRSNGQAKRFVGIIKRALKKASGPRKREKYSTAFDGISLNSCCSHSKQRVTIGRHMWIQLNVMYLTHSHIHYTKLYDNRSYCR